MKRGLALAAGLVGSGNESYQQSVINALGAVLFAYWPLWEAGGNTAADIRGNGSNAAYNGTKTLGQTGIGDGKTSALFVNGATTGLNIAGVSPVTNMDEGFCTFWMAIDNAENYLGTLYYLMQVNANSTDGLTFRVFGDKLSFYRRVGANLPNILTGVPKTARWIQLTVAWSVAQGKVWMYTNGTKVKPVSGTVATLTGALDAIRSGIFTSGSGGTTGWPGRGAHVVLGNGVPNDATIWALRFSGMGSGQVVVDGDSRSNVTQWPETAMESAFPAGDYCYGGRGLATWGVSGQSAAQMITNAAANIDPLLRSGRNTLIVWAGVNDGAGGADAATIYGRLQTYCQARRAAGWNKIIVCTEIDAQSVALDAVGWHSTIYPALNTLLNNDHSFADGLIDLGADARLQDATDVTYYNTDKIHLIAAGYAVVAEIAAPVIAAIA